MSASTNHRAHVLVMNDTQEVLDIVQMLLEEEGYRVSTSLHTLDIARIRDLTPDVIVLDLVFEHQLKGWHFLTLVRLDRQLCRVPLVLCTAAVTTVEPMRANLAAQQVRIVYKPFDIETLLAEIDEAVLGLPVSVAVDAPRRAWQECCVNGVVPRSGRGRGCAEEPRPMLDDPSALPPYDDRHHAAYDAPSVAILAAELLHRRVARGELDPIRVRTDAECLRGAVVRAAAAVVAMDLPYRARTEPTEAPAEAPTRPSAPKPNP